MIITPRPFTIMLADSAPRSPGIHVSGVVRDIGFQMGYIPPQYLQMEMDTPRVAMGLAWEEWVFRTQHPDVQYQPGEMFKCGIAGTCDGVSWVDEHFKIHECKVTWKSMKREQDLYSEWLWLSQTMCYCVMWNTQYACYHIYWVNGGYKRDKESGGPQYKLYDLEFTPRELEDNWNQINNRAKMLR